MTTTRTWLDLEEYIDLPDGGTVTRAQHIEQELEQSGRKLHDVLFTATEKLALS